MTINEFASYCLDHSSSSLKLYIYIYLISDRNFELLVLYIKCILEFATIFTFHANARFKYLTCIEFVIRAFSNLRSSVILYRNI